MKYLRPLFYILPLGLFILAVLDFVLRPVLIGEASADTAIYQTPHSSLLAPDAYAILRPNLRVEISDSSHPFTVETNQFGMRMGDVQINKESQKTRIAIMGDGVAFGWKAPIEESFPSMLNNILNNDSETKYEILNFAAPGFTSFHAVKQYEKLVHNFQPDVLILAFGQCDSFESRLSEPEFYEILKQNGLVSGQQGVLGFLNSYSTLGYWMVKNKREKIKSQIQETILERSRNNIWKKKVPSDSLKTYLGAVIEHHQKNGGKTILLNTNLFNFETFPALQELSKQYNISLLDIRAIFDGVGGYDERKTHVALNLENAGVDYFEDGANTTYLIRVRSTDNTALSKGLFITGTIPELGDRIPNTIRMYDDGTHGDERPGDRVWSLRVNLQKPQPVQFAFTSNGIKGQWGDKETGFDNNAKNNQFFFRFTPPPNESFIHWTSPVYEMNRIPFDHLLVDSTSHYLNKKGHLTLARRLASLIQEASIKKENQITQK